jgi:DNA-binding NarL/FixJ family response regulator
MTVIAERPLSTGTFQNWALPPGMLPMLPPAGSTTWPVLLDRVSLLSAREMEVFILLGVGASNRTLAGSLGVAERTVKAHVAQVMAKLVVESRLQAGLVSQVFQMTYDVTG